MKKNTTKKRSGWFWRWLKRLIVVAFLGFATAMVGVWLVYQKYAKDLPTLQTLADYRPSLVTRVFARDYQLLGEFFIERREFIPLSDMPEQLIQSFLAIEDSQFFQHPGVDIRGIIRAAIANFKAGVVVQGASTITQQVAKTFLLSSERKLERKIREVILSFRIEQRFTKKEILELYLNQIYLGAGAYGVGAAARIYFNRDVSELDLPQMAMLAALPKAPSNYSPWRAPEKAKERRSLVIHRMKTLHYITPEQAEEATQSSLTLSRPPPPLEQIAPHYLEHVRRTIQEEWGSHQLYRGGLDIYTSLNPRLQHAAQHAVREGLLRYDHRHGFRGALNHLENISPENLKAWQEKTKKEPPVADQWQKGVVLEVGTQDKVTKKNKKEEVAHLMLADGKKVSITYPKQRWWARHRLKNKWRTTSAAKPMKKVLKPGDVVWIAPPDEKHPQHRLMQIPDAESALVAIDPHTGQVLAMVGGYDFNQSEFNRATQALRQPGSAYKPIIYAAALAKGMSPVDKVDDTPIPITYYDPTTGRHKMWRAQNYEHRFYGPTTLRVALEHSRNLVTIRLLKQIGIPYAMYFSRRFGLKIPEPHWNLSQALGTHVFTPIDMASAYSVFANGGKLIKPVYTIRVQDRFGRTVYRHGSGDCTLCHQESQSSGQKLAEDGHQENSDTPFSRQTLSPEVAFQTTHLLRGVVQHGTGRRALRLGRPLAGKTGTTNDLKDSWFVGYSPSLVTAVWVGRDDATTLGARETGATAALPIWIQFMGEALKDQPKTDFFAPKGIHLRAIHGRTGTAASSGAKGAIWEAFREGQGPGKYSVNYDNYMHIKKDPKKTNEPLPDLEGGLY
ncbi:penicillin-binding protein 1A [Magnetococcales bacterium HHB-1]